MREAKLPWLPGYLEWLSKKIEEGRSRSFFSSSFLQHNPLTILERPVADKYALSAIQVWSEPASAPDHNFVRFQPVVTSEDGLNRPQDRLNIEPHSTQQIILQFRAVLQKES